MASDLEVMSEISATAFMKSKRWYRCFVGYSQNGKAIASQCPNNCFDVSPSNLTCLLMLHAHLALICKPHVFALGHPRVVTLLFFRVL